MSRQAGEQGLEISIGELSRLSGVNIETIRYYEKIGLLPAPPRSVGGRRIYGRVHADTLAFVRRARALGFGVKSIGALLALARPDRTSCAQAREIAAAHLDEVRAKLADLSRLEAVLSETIAQCDGEKTPACPVIERLGATEK